MCQGFLIPDRSFTSFPYIDTAHNLRTASRPRAVQTLFIGVHISLLGRLGTSSSHLVHIGG